MNSVLLTMNQRIYSPKSRRQQRYPSQLMGGCSWLLWFSANCRASNHGSDPSLRDAPIRMSQNGTWLEVINNPDDIFSKVGRDELQRLADRNRDLQAWTSDPAIIEKELKIKLVEEENKTLKHSIRL